MEKRVKSSVLALPILFVTVLISEKVFYFALFVVSFLGLYEYFSTIEKGNIRNIKPMKYLGIIMGLILQFLIESKNLQNLILPFSSICMLILLSLPVFSRKYNFTGAGATLLGIIYIPTFFSYLYLIRSIPTYGIGLIWFVFIISWLSDTSAYYSGRAFGRTKLCPEVSPHKTVEGAIGGLIGSTLGCIVYGGILKYFSVINIPLIHLVIMGITGSMISVLGDLSASSIKRNVGAKDFGNIIPGHGGILDRFDSILFVAPLVYYYITFIILG